MVYPAVAVSDNTISYGSGFLMASLYDLAWDALPNGQGSENEFKWGPTFGPQPLYYQQSGEYGEMNGYWSIPSPFGRYWKYWAWKMVLSGAAGVVMSYHDADQENRQMSFNEVGFALLGGLTSVVIHF